MEDTKDDDVGERDPNSDPILLEKVAGADPVAAAKENYPSFGSRARRT